MSMPTQAVMANNRKSQNPLHHTSTPTPYVDIGSAFFSMPSPDPSESLFFTSPSGQYLTGPCEEVQTLLAAAQKVKSLTPAVSNFLSTHGELFFAILRRQVETISARSQAFEDGHITVYDKTLLHLTHNGTSLENPAAVEYYCTEFLGISSERMPLLLSQKMLYQATALPALLTQGTVPRAFRVLVTEPQLAIVAGGHQTTPPLAIATGSCQKTPPSTIKDENNVEVIITKSVPEMEPKLKRMWDLYESSREDYLAKLDRNNDDTTKAAVFLRDTAENIISYLKDRNSDPIMMAELEAVYNRAKASVVTLKNGRKRKFDVAPAERVRGTPRQPRLLPASVVQPTMIPGQNFPARREDKTRRYLMEDTHSSGRASGQNFPSSRDQRYMMDDAHNGGPIRGHHGRGHSGIPFGYTRSVDSYHPYHRF